MRYQSSRSTSAEFVEPRIEQAERMQPVLWPEGEPAHHGMQSIRPDDQVEAAGISLSKRTSTPSVCCFRSVIVSSNR